jgi:hypothetical protein
VCAACLREREHARSKVRGVRCGPAGLGAGLADRPAGPGPAARNDQVIFDGRQQVARHDRLTGRLEGQLELDHYIEALIRKPSTLPGATAVERARAAAGTRVNNGRSHSSGSQPTTWDNTSDAREDCRPKAGACSSPQ